MRLQQGDNTIRCYWDGSRQVWELSYESTWYDNKPNVTIRNALVAKDQASPTGVKYICTEQFISHPGNSDSCKTSTADNTVLADTSNNNSNSNKQDSSPGVLLNVQVSGLCQHGTLGYKLIGWQPVRHGEHDQDGLLWDDNQSDCNVRPSRVHSSHDKFSPTSIQLLAHYQGCYYPTEVQTVHHDEESGNATLLLQIHIPPTAACLHHPGQPLPCLQWLTLELWSCERLLDSYIALVMPQVASQNSHASAMPARCWWWGSSPATTTAAATELQALTQSSSEQQHSGDGVNLTDLLFDLALWLHNVRVILQNTGICQMPHGQQSSEQPTARQQLLCPMLPETELLELAEDLLVYTQHAGLHGLKQMLKQQMKQLKPSLNKTTRSWFCRQCSRLQQSMFGFRCSMCESYYKSRLLTLLASVQAVYSTLMLASASLKLYHTIVNKEHVHTVISGTWMAPLAVVFSHHVRNIGRITPTCSPACAASVMIYAVVWLVIASGVIDTPADTQHLYNSAMGPAINILQAIGEQLPAIIFLPAPAVITAFTTIGLCQVVTGVGYGPAWLAGLLTMGTTVSALLLSDMHLRGMVMKSKTGNQATCTAKPETAKAASHSRQA